MSESSHDSYQEGRRGAQSTGTTVLDAFEYARGQQEEKSRQGGGMLVATVLLSPFICAAYPITGLLTLGTGFLVSKGGPLIGIKGGSGVLIIVTLIALVAAFFTGLALERRASTSKAYRIFRWIPRLVLAPGVVLSMMVGRGEVGIGRLIVLIILVPICYFLMKGLDRFMGTTGQGASTPASGS